MSNDLIAKLIKYGVYLSFLSILIISVSTYFPFIVGKYTFFRIVVEILFLLYLFLAITDKKYRPKLSNIFIFLALFIFFAALSTIFGVDSYVSFWSNYERMEGFLTLIHYFLFFIVIAGVFKKEKDFDIGFKVFFIVTMLAAFYGLFQKLQLKLPYLYLYQTDRIGSTLGNPAYLGALMVFGIFFAIFLFWNYKNIIVRLILGISIIFEFIILFLTGTRGALLAMIVGALLLLGFFIFTATGRNRKIAILIFILIVIAFGLLEIFKSSNFIRNNYLLSRALNFNLNDNTIQSRLISWRMAFEAFKERPILGWGPDIYIYIFNQYFIPDFLKYEGAQFDRAHSIIFDNLVSYGAMGLFLILMVLVCVFIGYFKTGLKNKDFKYFILASAIIAYFIQGIFIFDVLGTIIPLYFLFALSHFYLTQGNVQINNVIKNKKEISQPFPVGIFLIGLFIFSLIVILPLNLKPLFANLSGVDTLIALQVNNYQRAFDSYKKAIGYNTFGNKEIILAVFRQISKLMNSNTSVQDKNLLMLAEQLLKDLENQIIKHPRDLESTLGLINIYSSVGRATNQKIFLDKAEKYLLEAYKFAPKRLEVLENLALHFIYKKDYEKAKKIILEGINYYGDRSSNLIFYQGVVYYLSGDTKGAEEIFSKLYSNDIFKKQIDYFKEHAAEYK